MTTDAGQPASPALAPRHLENTDAAAHGYLSRTQALYGHRDSDRSYDTDNTHSTT